MNADVSEVYAVESHFICKNAYIEKLSSGEYYIFLKGIQLASIQLEIAQCFEGDPMKLYEYLFGCGSITFDLLETGV